MIIQTKFQYADRELVKQITENPYLQYFIGLPSYQEEAPFDASTLVFFRKHISGEMLMELNEYLLANKDDNNNGSTPPSSGDSSDSDALQEDTNEGTLTLDATCAPANIRYPQDISLLNSLSKRCYGMKCIVTKLEETQFTSIALSVFVTNLFKIQKRILCTFFI